MQFPLQKQQTTTTNTTHAGPNKHEYAVCRISRTNSTKTTIKQPRSDSLRAHVHLPLGLYRQTHVLVYKEHNKPNEKKKH